MDNDVPKYRLKFGKIFTKVFQKNFKHDKSANQIFE
jgi:hypothetical protein